MGSELELECYIFQTSFSAYISNLMIVYLSGGFSIYRSWNN